MGKEKQNLSVYLKHFYYAVQDDILPQEKHGFYDVIFGDSSPDTIWFNLYYWSNNSTKFKSNADVIHHLNPKTKILVTLRNPRRVFIGIYSVNIEDFLRVFPRKQIFISKLEDRKQNMTAALEDIFAFLDIEPMDIEVMRRVVHMEKRAKNTHGVPDMYNKTKQLLEEFFKPFNDRLGELIGQEYNYNLYP
ncbi:hypothetical protein ACF0H5_017501 [Mactra antiquata]